MVWECKVPPTPTLTRKPVPNWQVPPHQHRYLPENASKTGKSPGAKWGACGRLRAHNVHSLDLYKHPAPVRMRTEGQLPGMGPPRALDLKTRRAAPVNSSPAVGHPADAGPCPAQTPRTPPHKAPSIPVNVLPSSSSPPTSFILLSQTAFRASVTGRFSSS